jgi:hypothetical protein
VRRSWRDGSDPGGNNSKRNPQEYLRVSFI